MGLLDQSYFLSSIFKEHKKNKKSIVLLGEGVSRFLILYEYIKQYQSSTKLLLVLNYTEEDARCIMELLDNPQDPWFGSIGKTLKQNRRKKYLELSVAFLTSQVLIQDLIDGQINANIVENLICFDVKNFEQNSLIFVFEFLKKEKFQFEERMQLFLVAENIQKDFAIEKLIGVTQAKLLIKDTSDQLYQIDILRSKRLLLNQETQYNLNNNQQYVLCQLMEIYQFFLQRLSNITKYEKSFLEKCHQFEIEFKYQEMHWDLKTISFLMGLLEKTSNFQYYLQLIEYIGNLSNDFWSNFSLQFSYLQNLIDFQRDQIILKDNNNNYYIKYEPSIVQQQIVQQLQYINQDQQRVQNQNNSDLFISFQSQYNMTQTSFFFYHTYINNKASDYFYYYNIYKTFNVWLQNPAHIQHTGEQFRNNLQNDCLSLRTYLYEINQLKENQELFQHLKQIGIMNLDEILVEQTQDILFGKIFAQKVDKPTKQITFDNIELNQNNNNEDIFEQQTQWPEIQLNVNQERSYDFGSQFIQTQMINHKFQKVQIEQPQLITKIINQNKSVKISLVNINQVKFNFVGYKSSFKSKFIQENNTLSNPTNSYEIIVDFAWNYLQEKQFINSVCSKKEFTQLKINHQIKSYQLFLLNSFATYKYYQKMENEKSTLALLKDQIQWLNNVKTMTNLIRSNGKYIVVDYREFNSSLPYELYIRGFNLVPSMLKTGDYILYDQIAIERKDCKTGDLQTSVYKQRLQSQLKAQTNQYAQNYLLIENYEYIDASVYSDINKLIAIYKNLNILWSKSCQQSAIILEILSNKKFSKN